MQNKGHINAGLARRVDLMAVANPKATQRRIWISGLWTVWVLIGAVTSVVAGRWGVATILLGTLALSGSIWWAMLRAKRRVPETTRWLEELPG